MAGFFYFNRLFFKENYMATLLPKDADNNIIPTLRLKSGGAHALTATAVSDRNDTAFASTTRVVSLYATGPVFVRFGNDSVAATSSDHYFPQGIYYDFAISGGDKGSHTPYVAVLAVSTDCVVYVSEKE